MTRLRSLRVLLPICALTVTWTLMAQGPAGNQPQAPASYSQDPLVQSLKWRNIGNANLIGRISAIDALENDFTHVVVGSAAGGVFKSTNAGVTWTSIFDNYGAASIGDVAIFQKDPNIIWVGTGEECGRNSAAWGDGIYKSTDGGKDLHQHGAEGHLHDRIRRRAPDRSEHRLRRGRRGTSGARSATADSSRRSTAARRGRS